MIDEQYIIAPLNEIEQLIFMKDTLIKRKKMLSVFGIVLTIVLIIYWHHSVINPSTDDAYVQANIVNLAPQVSGFVSQVLVQNHQAVKTGDLLFTIDPAPFVIALQKAQAQLELAKEKIAANQDAVATATAVLAQRQAELTNATLDSNRALKLAKQGVLSRQAADDAKARIITAQAAFDAAAAELKQAQDLYGKAGDANATLKEAQAAVASAQLNLGYTKIYAQANGKIENLSLRAGAVVTANTAVFALIDDTQWWVDANYNETDMRRIRPGQKATVEIDMYPGEDFSGVVESISSGSGASFSLLPPENATGNWVKVTQRFPVRVHLYPSNAHTPFRVGASANVTIHTSTL